MSFLDDLKKKTTEVVNSIKENPDVQESLDDISEATNSSIDFVKEKTADLGDTISEHVDEFSASETAEKIRDTLDDISEESRQTINKTADFLEDTYKKVQDSEFGQKVTDTIEDLSQSVEDALSQKDDAVIIETEVVEETPELLIEHEDKLLLEDHSKDDTSDK